MVCTFHVDRAVTSRNDCPVFCILVLNLCWCMLTLEWISLWFWEGVWGHTACAPNLRHDLITAKFSSVIPKHSDWSIMMSLSGGGNININNFATLICGIWCQIYQWSTSRVDHKCQYGVRIHQAHHLTLCTILTFFIRSKQFFVIVESSSATSVESDPMESCMEFCWCILTLGWINLQFWNVVQSLISSHVVVRHSYLFHTQNEFICL